MPNYYTPGVYIEEVNKGPRPIEAVATSVAAFVGFAPAGATNTASLVTSWTQYVEKFGKRDERTGRKDPYLKNSYLSHAVFGFFLNGGTRCYVTRVVPPDAMNIKANALEIYDGQSRDPRVKPTPVLTVTPKENPPKEEIAITVERAAGTKPEDRIVTFHIRRGEQTEDFRNISLKSPRTPTAPTSKDKPADGDPALAPDSKATSKVLQPTALQELNDKSKLVQIALAPNAVDLLPAFGTYYVEVPQPQAEVLKRVEQQDIIGEVTERSGVVGLELADDVTIVCCPDLMSPLIYTKGDQQAEDRIRTVQLAMIAHCELVGGRMAVLDSPPDLAPQQVEQWRLNDAGYDSMFAALYYPWITVSNPLAGIGDETSTITVPPCGHVAGIYARNDSERGVHKAPANEVVRGVLDPVVAITNGEQDGLNPNGVNCIRAFTGRGVRLWGARTLSSDPAWRFINVRRLFNMVERSIERDTQWVVFEPNDPGLWSRVRRDVGAFLMTLWRDGMLFGNTPQEAFYVKCDEDLNPLESRDLGRLIIEVGLAPVKPAEFVIFRFSQYAGSSA